MAPYHILIVIISSVIPENLVLLTKSEQSGPKSAHIRPTQGGAHDSNSARYLFRVPMIHRFMTSHPVANLLLCFRAKHQDGRPMPFGFLVILTHRLTELCILNA